jgi:ankyrin repeat protein
VKDLLNFGADLNYADVEGHSALHFCALYGKTESAKILVSISLTQHVITECYYSDCRGALTIN